ncbi:MAG TPA: polyphosphate kinase 1 [Anaerolineae bacterium]|nr:polyphosphate kinase 1 [Anaerolineae bacterium]
MVENRKNYINREISWLSFNERVLQEAEDLTTPLIERMKFLGIFSSNLDEFFRVRVATLKRIVNSPKHTKALMKEYTEDILNEIQHIVLNQQNKFREIYEKILKELEKKNICIINEMQLTEDQSAFVKTYFYEKVRPLLFPVMFDNITTFPVLKDHSIYLVVRLLRKKDLRPPKHALIEVPEGIISRFLVLPEKDEKRYIILLDDVIRAGLKEIFSMFGFTTFDAYTIKLTRDAELDIEDDITLSFFEKMSKSLKQRKKGAPVRFIYDRAIPEDSLTKLTKKLRFTPTDTLIPGGRYHNFKDFMDFPPVGTSDLQYEALPPLTHEDIDPDTSMFSGIKKKDILLYYPYQSFQYTIDLLREASIDPRVISIKINLYRVAKNSNVIKALINAVRNGKSVTAVMELQARFDEEANIYWTDRLREEGARVIHGVPNLKVHCKLCLITRKEKGKLVHYVNIATGNYNENTARIYCDHSLFTVDKKITSEVIKLFNFFVDNYKTSKYRYLLVSPFNLRKKLYKLIRNEIINVRRGKKAYIIIKVNSLDDKEMINELYKASREGVNIKLIVRGICSLIPGIEGLSKHIQAVSIVDRFLEHSRVFVFCNGGEEKYYISSADWMTRNLDRRVEVACPIFDKELQAELKDLLDIQFRDNTKARELNENMDNHYKKIPQKTPVRAQIDFYTYLKEKIDQAR